MPRLIIAVIFFLLFYIGFLPVLAVLYIVRHFNKNAALRAATLIIRCFMNIELFITGTKVIAEGTENIPDERSVLFVGNHRSDFDILVTYKCMTRPVGYVAKASMAKIPIMAQWMDMIACLFLDRENARAGLKTILAAIDQLKSGTNVFIFPEGTRNRSEDPDVPMEFKEGSLKIAQKAKAPIVPVVIKDTEKIFEDHKPLIKAETVRIRFLKPVYTEDIPEEYRKVPAEYVRGLIADELQLMKKETNNS